MWGFFICKNKYKNCIFLFFFGIDIDDCLSLFCIYGSCINKINFFVCDCNFGYKGIFCD